MPTGVALRDPRQQLFAAAERILLRDGAGALTSRAVTAEAGCAKGVLHRHFADFDDFLAELVLDRIGRLEGLATALRESAGDGRRRRSPRPRPDGTVRSGRRRDRRASSSPGTPCATRLRRTTPHGVPLLTEATAMIVAYLAEERRLGRVAPDADVEALAPTLIGAGHLLFAGRRGPGAGNRGRPQDSGRHRRTCSPGRRRVVTRARPDTHHERSTPMSRHLQVTFDAHDPGALSHFWREVLGYVHPGPPGVDLPEGADALAAWDDFLAQLGVPKEARREVGRRGPRRARPTAVLPAGAGGQTAKNRVHLDVRVAPRLWGDERMAVLEAECERLIALGATRVRRHEPAPPMENGFIVMADPEGNEFCLD